MRALGPFPFHGTLFAADGLPDGAAVSNRRAPTCAAFQWSG